jgi:hypothetical protein
MRWHVLIGILAFAALSVCNVSAVLAQRTSTYTSIVPGEPPTIQSQANPAQVPGCACGISKDQPDSKLKAVQVSPASATAKVGEAVNIRFDASRICQGQTIRDSNGVEYGKPGFRGVGYVKWEELSSLTLPDTAGHAIYSGYEQAGKYTIEVNIAVQCYDIGARCTQPTHYNVCQTSALIPITVK